VNDRLTILQGDCVERLRELPDGSVQCCVTSPPYWGLRDYLDKRQIGHEKTPELYVARLVEVFQEVKRVLRDDATLWLNLGDCYAGGGNGGGGSFAGMRDWDNKNVPSRNGVMRTPRNYKPKDLIGIPWMTALALRADGWYLRMDNIWHKPNPMPESVTDRCTRAHEYMFHFSKSAKYYCDMEAIKDQPSPALIKQIEDGYNGHAVKDYLGASVQDASATKSRIINGYRTRIDKQRGHGRRHAGFNDKWDALTPAEQAICGRNKRSVWTVAPANYKESHFATFPPNLIKPCIMAGSRLGDTVLDPFGGSGTTAAVALELGRKAVTIELNPDYVKMIEQRTHTTPGLPL
jgi:DNA modification methylase